MQRDSATNSQSEIGHITFPFSLVSQSTCSGQSFCSWNAQVMLNQCRLRKLLLLGLSLPPYFKGEKNFIRAIFKILTRFDLFVSSTVRHGLKEQQKMEELQMKIIDTLRDHCTYNSEAQKKSNFFSRILGKTAELRSLSREGLQRMYYCKLENIIHAPPIIENLYLSSQLPF